MIAFTLEPLTKNWARKKNGAPACRAESRPTVRHLDEKTIPIVCLQEPLLFRIPIIYTYGTSLARRKSLRLHL